MSGMDDKGPPPPAPAPRCRYGSDLDAPEREPVPVWLVVGLSWAVFWAFAGIYLVAVGLGS